MSDKPKKVLILGSGALKIGEAGEFDYSGSQAIKALKDEGISTVLVNPNIATIQTSDYLADQIYFLPVNDVFVERVIQKERPDAVMLGFGGQTALNCGLKLAEQGVFELYGLRVLGTPIQAIRQTEDRGLFAAKLTEIGVKIPRSASTGSIEQALQIAEQIGYPVMLRVGYALGGLGSGLCLNTQELRTRANRAFAYSPQVLIEEFLEGWKEVEYEVVRDRFDNCVTVCNMENIDPMGIHTGESIVVAPSQTLTNSEYHLLRQIAMRVVRSLAIVGECNIQFALDPCSEDYRVIEVNARLSRSSALASKATGYPLALVAAKLGLGYGLADVENSMTGVTKACFEPALDYIVVKVPRWDLQKFRRVSRRIGSGMKSVGEVMAIGRRFEEALQKALRMLEIGAGGLVCNDNFKFDCLEKELREPTPERIFAIAEALRRGYTVDDIYRLTHIDKWFLYKIQHIVEIANRVEDTGAGCSRDVLMEAKQSGFSDCQIARLTGWQEPQVRQQRERYGIIPRVKQIDTLAAEYPAQSNYLYLTYNGQEDDIGPPSPIPSPIEGEGMERDLSYNGQENDIEAPSPLPSPIEGEGRKSDPVEGEGKERDPVEGVGGERDLSYNGQGDDSGYGDKKSVIVLGSGPYRIGSSVEFDWCSVNCVLALKKLGFRTIIINNNPETVSTDYNECDKLYFDELSLETVLEICKKEKPFGIIISMGGQTPNTLAMQLYEAGVNVRGTAPPSIDTAEDRHKFSRLLDQLGIEQPPWQELVSVEEIKVFAERVGYPVLVRPSYVLSGAAMGVASNDSELIEFLRKATDVSREHPVVVSKFVENANELEIDGVAADGVVMLSAISEHIENAGVHSGDATLVLPPQRTSLESMDRVRETAEKIVGALKISGPFNIQFIVKGNELKVIECNVRASRSFPFVSKILKVNFIELATRVIMGVTVPQFNHPLFDVPYVGVKAPQFSFTRLDGADPTLGVEMVSTGEVACLGDDLEEALLKALLSVGYSLSVKNVLLSTGPLRMKMAFLQSARMLRDLGMNLYATQGTADFLLLNGVLATLLHWPLEGGTPNVLDYIREGNIDLVVNIPKNYEEHELTNDYLIRRTAVDFAIPLITNVQLAQQFVKALSRKHLDDLKVKSWAEYQPLARAIENNSSGVVSVHALASAETAR